MSDISGVGTLRRASWRPGLFEIAFAGALLLLVAASLLPDGEFMNAVKLSVATPIVILVPGIALLRVIGWPATASGLLLKGFIWSLLLACASLFIAFAFETSATGAIVLYALVTLICVALGWNRPLPDYGRGEVRALLMVLGLGAAFGLVLIWTPASGGTGDWVEHLGRVRKIAELPRLSSLEAIQIVGPDTGIHPMYAFPLWHGVLAYIGRIVGLDPTFVVVNVASVLAPIAAVAAYHAGRLVFGSRRAGIATAVVHLVSIAIPWKGSPLDRLAYPGFICIAILFVAAIAFMFSYLRDRDPRALAALAGTSLLVTLIHASYLPLMLIPIGGFLLLHTVMERSWAVARAAGATLASLLIPFLLYLPWIYPIASAEGTSETPAEQLATSIETYRTLINVDGTAVRLSGDAFLRGGGLVVLAALLVPICVLAIRKRWGAFVVASFFSIAVALLTYTGFGILMDLMNMSQTRRLVHFLPVPFVIVGIGLIVARHRLALPIALVAGAASWLLWPGDFEYEMVEPGPGWLAWTMMILLGIGIAVAVVTRPLRVKDDAPHAALVALCLCIPVLIGSFIDLPAAGRSGPVFASSFVETFRSRVPEGDVVFGRSRQMYRLVSLAPVYVNAVARGHGGDTEISKLDLRFDEAAEFFRRTTTEEEGLAMLERYQSEWLVVDRTRPYPAFVEALPLEFSEGGFDVYAVPT